MEKYYKNLYNKYKNKYIKLKQHINQIGGNIVTDLSGLEIRERFNKGGEIKDYFLNNDIKKDDFYTLSELDRLLRDGAFNTEFLNRMIITNLFVFQYEKNNPFLYFVRGTEYYKNIKILFILCELMYKNILNHVERNNNTIFLVPGDSPSYFFFIIKLIHPELLLHPKFTAIEFPISSIGGAMDKKYIDGSPYITYLINTYIPSDKLLNEHNYLIFDYSESGKSVNYIKNIITSIYECNQPFNKGQEIIITDINISHYFLPNYAHEDYDKKKNRMVTRHPERWPIEKNKIRKIYLPDNFPIDFPENYPSEALYHKKLLQYLVDESDRRCQYKFKIDQANDFVIKNKETGIDIKNYYCEFNEKKFNYSLCNMFLLLFYIYHKMNTELITQTNIVIPLFLK